MPVIKSRRRVVKVNALSYALLIKLMLDGTYTCRELAEETGLHVTTVYDYTRALHSASAAHICTWEKDTRGRDSMPVFMLGAGRDKRRHTDTAAQRQAKARAKRKALEMQQVMSGQGEYTMQKNGRLKYHAKINAKSVAKPENLCL